MLTKDDLFYAAMWAGIMMLAVAMMLNGCIPPRPPKTPEDYNRALKHCYDETQTLEAYEGCAKVVDAEYGVSH